MGDFPNKKNSEGFTPLEKPIPLTRDGYKFLSLFKEKMGFIPSRDKSLTGFKAPSFLTGFTIVEAMIAIFILVVGLVGVSQLFPLSLSLGQSSKMTTQGIQFAKGKIEEITAKSYAEIRCIASLPPCEEIENEVPENTSFKRKTKIQFADPMNNLQEPSPPTTDTGLKKVEVIVSWNPTILISEESVSAITLITKK